jgi:5-methylcytosine-specific restriction endonuclease McrA
MVGRVLTKNHGITSRDKEVYALNGFADLTREQTNLLISECEAKLAQYLEKRGEKVWQHRTLAAAYISGTKKYEVLKRAKFRCELCGVSADEKALEVDHIEPRKWGGLDDLNNLQALCYTFRSWLKRPPRSPKDVAQRVRIREILRINEARMR